MLIDGSLLLGIRPEQFHPDGIPAGIVVCFSCQTIEHLGGVSYAYTDPARETSLTAEIRGMPTLKPGDQLKLTIKSEECLLFNADGARL